MKKKILRIKLGIVDIFVIKGKHLVLVDTGIRVTAEKFQKLFKQNGINPEDIKYIIITHGHSHHFAHAAYLKELTGAKIICHKKAVPQILNGTNPYFKGRTLFGKIVKNFIPDKISDYQSVHPDIIIENNTDLNYLGLDMKLLVTPGHSDCSLTIVLDNGEVIIGDMLTPFLFNPKKPDLASFVTDTRQLINSLSVVLKSEAKVFYGSHGGAFSRGSVEKMLAKYKRR